MYTLLRACTDEPVDCAGNKNVRKKLQTDWHVFMEAFDPCI